VQRDGARQVLRLATGHHPLSRLHPADLAEILEDLDMHKQQAVLGALAPEVAADALEQLDTETQVDLIEGMGEERATRVVEEMAADEAADLLSELEEEKAETILEGMEAERSEEVRELLAHEEDTAGALMTTDFIALKTEYTVDQTIAVLRQEARDAESIYYLYVLDDAEHLVGVVTLRSLIIASPERRLGELMSTRVISVTTGERKGAAAELFREVPLPGPARRRRRGGHEGDHHRRRRHRGHGAGARPVSAARPALPRPAAARSWLQARWKGLLIFLSVVGPGIITANVDNDAGGITTYSLAGAHFGQTLLWSLVPIALALVLVQEMTSRLGIVTGQGLADLIRERFGVRITFYLMLCLVVTNFGNAVAEFAGIASAMEIFGVSRAWAVPVAAFFVWWVVVKGTYSTVEKIFLGACVFYIAYIVAGVKVAPHWPSLLREVARRRGRSPRSTS